MSDYCNICGRPDLTVKWYAVNCGDGDRGRKLCDDCKVELINLGAEVG